MKSRILGGVALPLLALACSAPADREANAQSLERKGPPSGLAIPPPDVGAEDDPVTAETIGAPRAAKTIPAAFHGEWNSGLADCGTASEMRLRIEGDVMRFYESRAQVRHVEVTGNLSALVHAIVTGEGETREESFALTVSPDGRSIEVDSRGMQTTRLRCP